MSCYRIDKQIATYRMKIAPSLLQKIFICGATETPVISFNGRNKNKFFFHQLIFSQLAGSVAMSTLSSRKVSSICRAANDPSVFTITTTRAFSGLLLVDSAYLLVAAAFSIIVKTDGSFAAQAICFTCSPLKNDTSLKVL